MLCHISCRAVQPSQPRFELRWLYLAQGLLTCEYSIRQPFVSNLCLEDLQQYIATRHCNVVGRVYLENLIDSSFGLLSHLRSYMLDATEIRPPTFHRWTEMLEEMFDSRISTAQIRVHELAEDGPSQPRTVCHSDVNVGQAGRILIQQIEHLTEHRGLNSVRDMAFHFLLHPNRLLADRCIDFYRTCNVLIRC